VCPNDIRNPAQNLGQPLGVVLLIDVLDVFPLILVSFCVADVVDIETERFCQVIKPVQGQLLCQYQSLPFLVRFNGTVL
jgi:hypothetical protein